MAWKTNVHLEDWVQNTSTMQECIEWFLGNSTSFQCTKNSILKRTPNIVNQYNDLFRRYGPLFYIGNKIIVYYWFKIPILSLKASLLKPAF